MDPHRSRELKASILVVDPAQSQLRALTRLLTEKGYQICLASNGRAAVQSVQTRLPHLVLLDLDLPDLDGYQVCQILKADQRTRNVPVIFLSALGTAQAKVRAFAVGGIDYITKPFQVEEVIARIENQLNQQKLHQQLLEQLLEQRLIQQNFQRQQTEHLLEQQLSNALLLQQVTEALRSQLDSQKAFEAAVDHIGQVFQVSRATIHIYVPPPIPEIPLVAEYVQPGYVSMRQINFTLEDNRFIPAVLAHDRAIAAADVYRDTRLQSIQSLCKLAAIKSLLAVRTSYRNQANGVITLQHCGQQHRWTPAEIALVETIAAQIGLALAQTQSVEREQKQLEALSYQNLILRQEICERRQVETALQDSEAELRGLFAAIVDVILVLDRQGRYLRIAPTNQENLYKPASELLGKTLHEVFPLAQADRFLGHIQNSLNSLQAADFEYSLEIQGRMVWFSTKV